MLLPCAWGALQDLIRAIREKKWPVNLLIIGGMLLLSAVSTWKSGNADTTLFMAFVVAPFLLKIRVGKALIAFSALQIVIVLLTSVLSMSDQVMYNTVFRAGALRVYFGFTHPTHGPILFLFASMMLLMNLKDRGRKIALPLLFLGHVFFYRYTDSRTCFAVAAVLTLGTWALMNFPKLEKWLNWISPAAMPVSVLFSFIAPFTIAGMGGTDNFFGRLRLAQGAMQTYPVTLFGQPIKWVGVYSQKIGEGAYNFVDNHYTAVLLEYGLVYLLLVLAIYAVILAYGIRAHKPLLTLSVVLALGFAIMEPRLWQLTFNALPLFFGEAMIFLMQEHQKKKQLKAPPEEMPAA